MPGHDRATLIIDKVMAEGMADTSKNIAIEEENIFLLYASFCGDVPRTAHAAETTPARVIELAEQGKWNEKLHSIIEMKKSGKAGDVERAMNRAINFVQASRLRKFIERVLAHICKLDDDEMQTLLTIVSYDKIGNRMEKIATRPLTDLAAALEKCHGMTYMALNDSVGERKERGDQPDADVSGSELHAKIALAVAGRSASPSLSREAKSASDPGDGGIDP